MSGPRRDPMRLKPNGSHVDRRRRRDLAAYRPVPGKRISWWRRILAAVRSAPVLRRFTPGDRATSLPRPVYGRAGADGKSRWRP